MPTWDTYEDLKAALDLYVAANPNHSYVLVITQSNDEKDRAYAKVAGNMDSAVAVEATDDALADFMSIAAAAHGMEVVGEEDDDNEGEDEDEPESWQAPPSDTLD